MAGSSPAMTSVGWSFPHHSAASAARFARAAAALQHLLEIESVVARLHTLRRYGGAVEDSGLSCSVTAASMRGGGVGGGRRDAERLQVLRGFRLGLVVVGLAAL